MKNWKLSFSILTSVLILQGATNLSQMEFIPGGSFVPLYTVGDKTLQVDPFFLDIFPVTNQDFLNFLKQNPKWQRSKIKRIFAEKDYLKHWTSDLSFPEKLKKSPVTFVSWFSARAYCKSLGKTLPTSAEWEYVALASDKKPDGAREKKFRQRILEWYGKPTPEILPAIKNFKNVYGIYDMHGLVWEWVKDFNTILVTGESREDTGLNRNLYCAGGAAGSTDPSDYAAYMRYAYRSSLKAHYTIKNLGFRCSKRKNK